MKIGFDISQTGHLKAGTGYLAYSLIRALAQIDTQNEYLLYPTFGDFFLDPDWTQTMSPIDQTNFQRGLGHRNLKDASEFWRNPLPDFEEKLGNPDLIHANNFYCPSGFQHAHLIYTLYDLGFLAEPDTTTETNRIGCFTGVFRASLYAKHILAISNYTRQHFLDTFPHYPPEKMSAIPLASRVSMQEPVPAPIQEGTIPVRPNQFWLNVGTLGLEKTRYAC